MNKKIILILVLVLAFTGLMYSINKPNPENSEQAIVFVAETPYPQFLDSIRLKKKSLETEAAKQYMFEIFNNYIPLYWEGTKWDFNGVTRQPKQGDIACGYFITNTLSDIGLEIPRIKLAQAPSSVMINQLCVDVKHFSDFEKLKSHILNHSNNGVYIVGLDFHTGYILKNSDEIYFLHSNYIQKQGVIKEEAENSQALRSSKSFMIGSLTANDALIQKWLTE